jgi:hypothetical protein
LTEVAARQYASRNFILVSVALLPIPGQSDANRDNELSAGRDRESEGLLRPYHADASNTSLFANLIAKSLHPRPMYLWTKVMFGLLAVKQPVQF